MMIYCGTSHIIRKNTLVRLQQGHFKFFSDENNLIGECIFLINVKVYLCRCCTSFVEILQVLPIQVKKQNSESELNSWPDSSVG